MNNKPLGEETKSEFEKQMKFADKVAVEKNKQKDDSFFEALKIFKSIIKHYSPPRGYTAKEMLKTIKKNGNIPEDLK